MRNFRTENGGATRGRGLRGMRGGHELRGMQGMRSGHGLRGGREALSGTRGSTLTWSLIVAFVLVILVGILATIIMTSSRQTASSQMGTQAYYTARSVSERITGWLAGSSTTVIGAPTEQQRFIIGLASAPVHEEYSEADLGGNMGRAEVDISINAAGDIITIVTTGFFGDQEETITSTLKLTSAGSFSYQGISFPNVATSDFETRSDGLPYYVTREVKLNARIPDTNPTIVGNERQISNAKTMEPYNDNTNDITRALTVSGPNDELTWQMVNGNWAEILGTASWPANGSGTWYTECIRHFMAPANGRWTINPLSRATSSPTTDDPINSQSAKNNTRPIMLSLNGTTGKDMEMRLGGNSSSNAPISGSFSYYNALLGFDLTDNYDSIQNNDTQNSFVEYYDDNDFDRPLSLWHPQFWNSMTFYTQAGTKPDVQDGVNTRLVFGPYVHVFRLDTTYTSHADYYNWGRYVGNKWYGQKPGDFNRAFPGNEGTGPVPRNRRGMAYIPEYYGNDAQFFFLDPSTWPVLFIQGMNILDQNGNTIPSAIYSRRGVELGGGLVKTIATTYSGRTTRNVNNDIDGIDSVDNSGVQANYFATTTRYSQILYNTDIVLRTPNGAGTPRQSRIFDASLPDDGSYRQNNAFSNAYNKRFSPTVRIIGGDIYVGAGQTLTIDGGRINDKNKNAGTATHEGRTIILGTSAGEYTQVIAPNSITVAEEGTLVVRGRIGVDTQTWAGPSAYANIDAPIYVEGSMVIEEGAYLTNQIFCYGKGTVSIKDVSATNSTANKVIWNRRTGADGEHDGIYVFDGGTLNLAQNAAIELRGAHIFVGVDSSGGTNVGTMNIGQNSAITGDTVVYGTLNVEGNFTLDVDSTSLVDDPSTPGTDESDADAHGIFIYNDSTGGGATLNINSGVTQIWGNSGKMHGFGGYPSITDHNKASAVFCNKRNIRSNVCEHWQPSGALWLPETTQSGRP